MFNGYHSYNNLKATTKLLQILLMRMKVFILLLICGQKGGFLTFVFVSETILSYFICTFIMTPDRMVLFIKTLALSSFYEIKLQNLVIYKPNIFKSTNKLQNNFWSDMRFCKRDKNLLESGVTQSITINDWILSFESFHYTEQLRKSDILIFDMEMKQFLKQNMNLL